MKRNLEWCNPFSAGDPSLRNIITGLVTDDNVNVDEFVQLYRKVLTNLLGNELLI